MRISSVLAVVSTDACATAPRMCQPAPGMRSRTDMPYNMAALSDLDSRLLFRMERGDFWALLRVMRDRLETNEEMAILSSGQPVPLSADSPLHCVYWQGHRIWTSCWILEWDAVRSSIYSSRYVSCAYLCGAVNRGWQAIVILLFVSGICFCLYSHVLSIFLPFDTGAGCFGRC